MSTKRAADETGDAGGSKRAESVVTAVTPPARLDGRVPHVRDMATYKRMYEESISNPDAFWGKLANEMITWRAPYDSVLQGSLAGGDVTWFANGKLNVCENCVDRHAARTPDKIAFIWEADEPGQNTKITYKELLQNVCRVANALKRVGVRKGDAVCIYMPMVLETVYAMLACARIGAPHSVVFGGFSAESLRDRINDCRAKVLFTADEGMRGGRPVPLKKIADAALLECSSVQHVFVTQRSGNEVPFSHTRDIWLHEAMAAERPFCPMELMDAEDVLFLLYTSGSTGKPKGVAHTTAGYLLYAAVTHRYVFDYHEGDIYAAMADVGWITGHSYIVYGPLCNGATGVLFESVPTYPDAGRYWDVVDRLQVTQLYTAPTVIRTLMKFGVAPVHKYKRSSLRVLGSVGEPINPEAWRFYFEVVGDSRCPVVDTFWQTETGGVMITGLPFATPMKPGSASLPFFGIKPVVRDAQTGRLLDGPDVEGVLCFDQPWPSMLRTVFGDHARFLATYLKPYPGSYFTGDGCKRDSDGYLWITGRVDDVLNVSGHRLGTAEIESALVSHPSCAEAAVVGITHDIKGQGIFAYCVLRDGFEESASVIDHLRQRVRAAIGPIATPDAIVIAAGLPKTRSGKIMRRILRKIANHEEDSLGDISTLADPAVVADIIERVKRLARK